jgi:hypothetical protein
MKARAGHSAEALALCEDGLREAAAAGLADAPSSAQLHLAAAEALLVTGERDAAREQRRGMTLARRGPR